MTTTRTPRTAKSTDSVTRSAPNMTEAHLHRNKPPPLVTSGLHAVASTKLSARGKVLISPVAQPAELAARRLSERLELDTGSLPMRNSTMRQAYTGAELATQPSRAGAADAFAIRSRSCFTKG